MSNKCMSMAIVATAGIILASPALAGEENGNGESTPIRDYIASFCAFSGLEDDDALAGRGVTQTPHYVEGEYPPPGAAAVCAILNPGKKPQ
jgi:hypothetical protein